MHEKHTLEKHYLEAELERLVQSSPEMWSFLQQGSLDGCWYWDLERPENEWMSPEFWQLFGIDPTTRRHDPAEWQDLIFPEDRDIAIINFQKHLADPDHPYDQVVRYRHADGSTVWVRCRGIAIRDASGTPVRMLGAHNDLTAVKRAEADANDQRVAAETANEELRAFCYAISHDMRGPSSTLAMLLNELEESQRDNLDDDGRQLLALGRQTLNQMHDRIAAVLRYTGVVDGVDALQPVSLEEVFNDVVNNLGAELTSKDASIRLSALPTVLGDPDSLRMLFHNLLSNAVKFSRDDIKPDVAVHAEPEPASRRVFVRVTDNGIGIDPEHTERIFDIFVRLHAQHDYPGHGMGLPTSRRIAQHHGGQITVQSVPGKGSVFSVSLAPA